MKHADNDGLVSASDIADMAGVSRAAVSNWRKRVDTFPKAIGGTEAKPLFSRRSVTEWLSARGHSFTDSAWTEIWSAFNLLREEVPLTDALNIVLGLAVEQKTGDYTVRHSARVRPWLIERVRQSIERLNDATLADTIDFALERIGKSQGKSGGEIGFVGSRVSVLLSNLAVSQPVGILYDPACGVGAALLSAADRPAGWSRVVANDVNQTAVQITTDRAILRDLDIEITQSDLLREDVAEGLKADVIILDPPIGIRFDFVESFVDPRFAFGLPPKSSADFAWIQHAIAHLSPTGVAYVLSAHGPLFRGGREKQIRTELIRRGCVEAIVSLPGKFLPNTTLPLALWVLRSRNVRPEAPVLFIDAGAAENPELRIADWLCRPDDRMDVPHAEVAIAGILASDSNLSPKLWVQGGETEPDDVRHVSLQARRKIAEVRKLIAAEYDFDQPMYSLAKARVLTVRDLVETGVLDVLAGKPRERYALDPSEIEKRYVTASDVRDGVISRVSAASSTENENLTQASDVLITTMNTVRATIDKHGDHLPGNGVFRLRVKEPAVLSPDYLAMVLQGPWNSRLQSGSTIQRARVHDLEVPLLPQPEQRDLVDFIESYDLLERHASELAHAAHNERDAILNSVRYNIPLDSTKEAKDK